MPIRAFLQHHWPAITIAVTAAAIGCAAFLMLGNMPPHRIVMATGPEGSAYAEYGKRYRAALAKAGVEVQLRSTAGSVETAALLRDPPLGRERRPDPGRHRRRREYRRPRIIGGRGLRAVVVVPET